MVSLIPQNST